jgi:hypothetical protein
MSLILDGTSGLFGNVTGGDISGNFIIDAANLEDGSVTEPKIEDGSVTEPKIAPLTGLDLTPEVIDLNKSPIFRKLSEYIPTVENTWVFAHTGQSLAEGGVGGDTVNGLIPYPEYVKMLSSGPVGLNTETLGSSILTLAEKTRVTIASSYMRNARNSVLGASENVIFHGQAWGGKSYNELKKGGTTVLY